MNRILLCTAALAALNVTISAGFAGQVVSDGKDSKKSVIEPCPPTERFLITLESSYTSKSDFDRGKNNSGDSWFKQLKADYRIPLGDFLAWPNEQCGGWFLRLGGTYGRWDFDNDGGLPLPNHLQSISATLALEYLVRGKTGILLETEPGVYFEDNIAADTFDSPTKLALVYQVNDRFVLVGGVSYTALRSSQFLPIVGFVWTINDQWEVYAVPPEPRILYTVSDKLKFWAGGEIAGGSYRTDGEHFKKKESLNNAVLTYSEYRAGVGVIYGDPKCQIELGAGYAFQRKFDFHRAEEGYETKDGAPYVKVEFHSAF